MSASNPSNLSPKSIERYKLFMAEGKELAASGMLLEAVEVLQKASKIHPSEKVLNRIKKLQEFIKENVDNNDDGAEEEMIEVASGFSLHHDIYDKLFSYQRTGVAWMYGLFKKKKGGVLGDDMGLGKTFQVIGFLSGMIDANLVNSILIIMPVSLLQNWKKEFADKCPGIMVYEFHGTSKKQREQNVVRVQRRGGVLLTSYGMVISNMGVLDSVEGRSFIWDYVILDEGHKIKNPTKTTKAVHEIPARNRLVLTGTPLQNNLRELWALYDFTHHGTLLGSQKTFKMQYETPITRSREKDSTLGERKLGTEMAESLKQLISPYFLRRTKEEVFKMKNGEKGSGDVDELNEQFKNMELSMKTRKNDFIIWLFLSTTQHEIYTSFLQSDSVKQILIAKRSPLVELTVLKKICDHPRLLSIKACMQLGLNGEMSQEELFREIEDERTAAASIDNVSDEDLINESGKLKFTIQLLEHLRTAGHRTLVFSLSRKILDMIHRILTQRNWKVLRVDGTITKMEERQKRIDLFQNNSSFPVFLLTTQVGGVGLTLTAADRVIIYDPSWNPATDAQAVDRVYRIGQMNNVVIYRLITCGTVEEKIYRNQIFKDSITRQTTSQAKDPHRYFSKQELRELFAVEDIYHSKTQEQLARMHSNERTTDTTLDEHIAYIHTMNIFGISDHNLMFSKEVKDPSDDHDEASVSNDYIKRRVEMAQMMVRTESSVVEEGMRQTGTFVKPFTLPIPSAKKQQPDGYKAPQFPDVIDLTAPKLSPRANFRLKGESGSDADVMIISPPSKYNKSPNRRGHQSSIISLVGSGDAPNLKASAISVKSPRRKVDAYQDPSQGSCIDSHIVSPPSSNRKANSFVNGTPKRDSIVVNELRSRTSPRNSVSRSLKMPSPNIDVKKNFLRNSSSSVTTTSLISTNIDKSTKNEDDAVENPNNRDSKSIFTNPPHSSNVKQTFFTVRSPKRDSDNVDDSENSSRGSFTKPPTSSPIPKIGNRHSSSPIPNAVNEHKKSVIPNIKTQHTSSPIPKTEVRQSKDDDADELSLISDESLVDISKWRNPASKSNTTLMKTRLFDDTFDSLSFPDQVSKGLAKRKSCVNRRSTMLMSESDSSKSCASTNTSVEIVVADSEEDSDSESSNDSSSPSILEDSSQSSLLESRNGTFVRKSVTPERISKTVNKIASDSTKRYGSPSRKFTIKNTGSADKFSSPKRITPLRVDPAYPSPSNTAFEKAVVASKELSPLIEHTVKTSHSKTRQPTYLKNKSVHSENDSPIIMSTKKATARKIIESDSSDNESYSKQKISMSEKSKVRQRYSKGASKDLNECLTKLTLAKSLPKKFVAAQSRGKDTLCKPLRLGKKQGKDVGSKLHKSRNESEEDMSDEASLEVHDLGVKKNVSKRGNKEPPTVESDEQGSEDLSEEEGSEDLSGEEGSEDSSGESAEDLSDELSGESAEDEDLSDDISAKNDLSVKGHASKRTNEKKQHTRELDEDASSDEGSDDFSEDGSVADSLHTNKSNGRKLVSKKTSKKESVHELSEDDSTDDYSS